MTFKMSGQQEAAYRATKDIPVTAQRHCLGTCRKMRSIAQFAGDDTICIQCRRRMPKVGA